MKKFKQHEKLPKKIAETGDDPIADKDLPERSRHRPEDDQGDAHRKDKG